jgi:hypothetical protein
MESRGTSGEVPGCPCHDIMLSHHMTVLEEAFFFFLQVGDAKRQQEWLMSGIAFGTIGCH